VISIHVANSCPGIYIDQQHNIAIGHNYLDGNDVSLPSGVVQRSRVCTDLWNATIIDRQDLVAILAKHVDNPEQVVDEYLKSNVVDCIDVLPGSYTLYDIIMVMKNI
jgi:hypothetical protein